MLSRFLWVYDPFFVLVFWRFVLFKRPPHWLSLSGPCVASATPPPSGCHSLPSNGFCGLESYLTGLRAAKKCYLYPEYVKSRITSSLHTGERGKTSGRWGRRGGRKCATEGRRDERGGLSKRWWYKYQTPIKRIRYTFLLPCCCACKMHFICERTRSIRIGSRNYNAVCYGICSFTGIAYYLFCVSSDCFLLLILLLSFSLSLAVVVIFLFADMFGC